MNFKFDGTENELFERVRFSEDGRGKEGGNLYLLFSLAGTLTKRGSMMI